MTARSAPSRLPQFFSGGQFAESRHRQVLYGQSAQTWNRGNGLNLRNGNANLLGEHGNWSGRHDWDNDFNRGRYAGYGGYGWGGFWPWFGGWDLGFNWGYPYDYGYYYPDLGDYYYSYAPADYVDGGMPAAPDGAPSQLPPATMSPSPTMPEQQQEAGDAIHFYSEARTAFLQNDYGGGLRLAEHSAVEAPGNAKVHELISLAMFALKNYTAAASKAHAAMALGPIADWNDLFGYYNDPQNYTAALATWKSKSTRSSCGPWKRRRRTIPNRQPTISCWRITT